MKRPVEIDPLEEDLDEIVVKVMTEKQWNPAKYHSGEKINGWREFVKLGLWQSDQYPFRKKWEKGFKTETKKFEFYSETLKKTLGAQALG